MTLTEEDPRYPERVAAYLARNGRRRLPWGAIVAGGGLTYMRSTGERTERAEIGEVAIELLAALGVTEEMLDKLAALPADTPADALRDSLVHEMQLLRAFAAATSPEVKEAADASVAADLGGAARGA